MNVIAALYVRPLQYLMYVHSSYSTSINTSLTSLLLALGLLASLHHTLMMGHISVAVLLL